jgi:hypothetical protein
MESIGQFTNGGRGGYDVLKKKSLLVTYDWRLVAQQKDRGSDQVLEDTPFLQRE